MQLPPLSLYIHIPWCIQKCPYCDFNSHTLKTKIDEQSYIKALLNDLDSQLKYVQNRSLSSIFFGGGTPSIMSAEAIAQILQGVQSKIQLAKDCEITLEANPGTLDNQKFIGFKQAGVNRFSIGVQSFQADKLQQLGRIHNPAQAIEAAKLASRIGLKSFNLDLMHGLPNQSVENALYDLEQAIACDPQHISWYQLTIEPNTLFASKPPTLPDDDVLWDIQQQGQALLAQHGYTQYEISAYAKDGYQSKHNLNYWRFGDYLAIGCGAHAKISLPEHNKILRFEKIKHPSGYISAIDYTYKQRFVDRDERIFEYFMNRFRLFEACPKKEFADYTGLELTELSNIFARAKQLHLIDESQHHWTVSAKGHRYLNELLELFIDDE
ncbi:oxygen-independent coproporphyrinogen III oxidase [Catenovulum agarivorans DS-2]|uniref:Heme chaperone HemW n=1 Tax=Catenovulum agarivorans DS-2 TaxID=1328313 RepID=W7QGD4_9ALTE|nr:radical SAM family heme chaperone HemW [Catenovulum agarivorans]EWH11994.1 oxygen-independent coproporphyrinogen III oxidase [Catenovulum agarivorans DS-2]